MFHVCVYVWMHIYEQVYVHMRARTLVSMQDNINDIEWKEYIMLWKKVETIQGYSKIFLISFHELGQVSLANQSMNS